MAKLASMTINRSFDHKKFGRVGVVEMVAEVGEVTINGSTLPAASVEYLLTFALQNLQDAYAGAESTEDAGKRWSDKLARLIEGNIGVRSGGTSVSREVKVRRNVLAEQIRVKGKGEVLKGLEGDERATFLDSVWEKQSDDAKAAIMALVAERIAEEDARKAQAKTLADTIEL